MGNTFFVSAMLHHCEKDTKNNSLNKSIFSFFPYMFPENKEPTDET